MPNSIKFWRKRKKMLQRELSDQLREYGFKVNRPIITVIENNIVQPGEDLQIAISRILGCMETDIYRPEIND